MNSLVSVTTRLHAWKSGLRSVLTVALRPISPHCQTVVSRKRETKAETRGGVDGVEGDVFKTRCCRTITASCGGARPLAQRRRTDTEIRASDRSIGSTPSRVPKSRRRMMKYSWDDMEVSPRANASGNDDSVLHHRVAAGPKISSLAAISTGLGCLLISTHTIPPKSSVWLASWRRWEQVHRVWTPLCPAGCSFAGIALSRLWTPEPNLDQAGHQILDMTSTIERKTLEANE